MNDALILLVDDEPNITQLARMYLQQEGFRCLEARDGAQAMRMITDYQPALVVLDLMLPEMDGLTLCRRLREEGNAVPILMLTARDEDMDKILGLELGADDYMTKPFNPRELVARIKAILRRGGPVPEKDNRVITIEDLTIDLAAHEVKIQGQIIPMRSQEFDLLKVLAQHHGIVLSREKLLRLAWGYDFMGQTRTVDVHISHLRKRLTGSKVHIETITGVGYKLIS